MATAISLYTQYVSLVSHQLVLNPLDILVLTLVLSLTIGYVFSSPPEGPRTLMLSFLVSQIVSDAFFVYVSYGPLSAALSSLLDPSFQVPPEMDQMIVLYALVLLVITWVISLLGSMVGYFLKNWRS